MEKLLNYIESRFSIRDEDRLLLKKYFVSVNVPAQTMLLEAGKTERYVYFLSEGIVKGYQNIDGKLVIQHLVSDSDFFTSLDSFISQTPSLDYYETITACKLMKITKTDFEFLQEKSTFWNNFVKIIINENLSCKMKRVTDFQIMTAKERYLKFLAEYPKLALNVSVDNIASFLGMAPQSLSRIRKEVIF